MAENRLLKLIHFLKIILPLKQYENNVEKITSNRQFLRTLGRIKQMNGTYYW